MESLDDKRSKTPNVKDWFLKDKSVFKPSDKSDLFESSSSSDSDSQRQSDNTPPIAFPSLPKTNKSLLKTEKVRNSCEF